MAFNFSANQFDSSFKAQRLGNWEAAPREAARPRTRSGCTKFVADERGHLLPGLARAAPWGRGPFSAWDHPKRITRALAAKQMQEAEQGKRFGAWLKRSAHVPLPQQQPPPTPPPPPPRTDSSAAASKAPDSLSEIKPPSSAPSLRGPSSANGSSRPRTASARSSLASLKLPAPAASPRSDQTAPPLGKAYSTFEAAKCLAQESGAHQPLADTLLDPLFSAAGPKTRGLRPLTSSLKGKDESEGGQGGRRRPSTSHPLRHVSEMDLAIRWDLRLSSSDQQKLLLPKVGVAVFNTVAPPQPKLAWEAEAEPEAEAEAKNPGLQKRRSRSSPNLTRRPCAACAAPAARPPAPAAAEFKQAFKAGVWRPRTAAAAAPAAAPLAVPKPKKPFSKRSYSIGTLAPPFSLWPDGTRRQDYPDHWRLASVYQHSYKPLHFRKKPLLATLFH